MQTTSRHNAAALLGLAGAFAVLLRPAGAVAAAGDGTSGPATVREVAAAFDLDLGPLASRDLTTEGYRRTRLLGPLVEMQSGPSGRRFFAVRPFYSRTAAPERTLHDVLWPVAQAKTFLGEEFVRVLTFFHQEFDDPPPSRFRSLLLPLWFYGQDEHARRYMAIFPVGGRIEDFLGQDSLAFVLFPLYSSMQVKDVRSHAVLWPLVSWGHGPGVERFRVFPFYGRSRREDQWEKRFVLWPVWNSVRYEYPDEKGGGFILFPLFGHVETGRQETWMLLPPLIRWSGGDDYREILAPWPFVQYRRGPDEHKFYLWPLWGTKSRDESREQSFALWPLVWWMRAYEADQTQRSFYALPFFYSRSRRPNPAVATDAPTGRRDSRAKPGASSATADAEPEATYRYWKVWPLVSYRRQRDASEFRAPALWPLERTPAIERNLAPLWTLYRQTRNGRAFERECLWGLYRRQRRADGRTHTSVFPLFSSTSCTHETRWSVLGGLFGYRRERLQKRVRLLYFLDVGLPGFDPDNDGERTPIRDANGP